MLFILSKEKLINDITWDPLNPDTPHYLLYLHHHDGEVWPSRNIEGIFKYGFALQNLVKPEREKVRMNLIYTLHV